jgi:hypothetical protein
MLGKIHFDSMASAASHRATSHSQDAMDLDEPLLYLSANPLDTCWSGDLLIHSGRFYMVSVTPGAV